MGIAGTNPLGVVAMGAGTFPDLLNLELYLDGSTSVTATGGPAVVVDTISNDHIMISIGPQVAIDADGTGVVGLSEYGSGVTVVNDGVIHAGQASALTNISDVGGEGISAIGTGSDSPILVTNNGIITSDYGRGIYAEGRAATSGKVAVSVDNEGSIQSWLTGIRALNYINGDVKVINGMDGTITSGDRQGIFAVATGAASAENRGTITAENGSGMDVWGGTGATVDNYGSVTANRTADRTNNANEFIGIEAIAQTTGDVVVTNHAGATVNATSIPTVNAPSIGIYALSYNGSATIENQGVVKAASAGLYAVAKGGTITITNDGVVGADGNGYAALAAATLGAVTDIRVTNAADGIVTASSTLAMIPTLGELADLSSEDQATFATAAAGRAIRISADGDIVTADNAGTLVGTVNISSRNDTIGTASFNNSGLWAFTGTSGFSGSIADTALDNTGAIWALGDSALTSDLGNDGMLWVSTLDADPGRLAITGDFNAGANSALVFDASSLAAAPGDAVLTIDGDASGSTKVVMADPAALSGLGWNNLPRGTVVQVLGTPAAGASSFTMDQTYGLLTLGLDYSAGSQSWQLAYDTNAAGETLAQLGQAGRGMLDSQFGAVEERLAWFRGAGVGAPNDVPVTAYAEPERHVDPTALAIASESRPTYSTWARSIGAYGDGEGYLRRSGGLQGGFDGRFSLDAGRELVLGLAASYGVTQLRFSDSGNGDTLTGPGLGAYAGLTFANGAFVDLHAGWQGLETDIDLGGLSAHVDGSAYGGKLTTGRTFAGAGMLLTPVVAVSASHSSFDGFAMQNLDVDLGAGDAVTAEAGLDLARRFTTDHGVVKPFGSFRVGDRWISGGDVAISNSGTYADTSDGLFGRAQLGIDLASPSGRATTRLAAGVSGDADETSWDIRLSGGLAF